MNTRRIWLHIGAEKTGTTTIQDCLRLNREALAREGVLFPVTPGEFNHTALAAYAMPDEAGIEELRIAEGLSDPAQLPAFRARFRQRLSDEIEASGAHTVILSNEHCSSRLHTPADVERLHQLLAPLAADIRVIFYIRHPVPVLESWYSTAMTSGGWRKFPVLQGDVMKMADWATIARRWASVFGSAEIAVRRLERDRLEGGDLLTDFFHAAGLSQFPFQRGPRHNESLGLKPLLFLRAINLKIPRIKDGAFNPERGPIDEVLRLYPSEERFRLTAEEAETVDAFYAESYDRMRRTFFPLEDGPLFEPHTRAPGPRDETLTEEDILDIAAFLWRHRR